LKSFLSLKLKNLIFVCQQDDVTEHEVFFAFTRFIAPFASFVEIGRGREDVLCGPAGYCASSGDKTAYKEFHVGTITDATASW
jgi:hypothetical protein